VFEIFFHAEIITNNHRGIKYKIGQLEINSIDYWGTFNRPIQKKMLQIRKTFKHVNDDDDVFMNMNTTVFLQRSMMTYLMKLFEIVKRENQQTGWLNYFRLHKKSRILRESKGIPFIMELQAIQWKPTNQL